MDKSTKWFVGSNGNWFKDAAGARWCVWFAHTCRYGVSRNGVDFPERFDAALTAMNFAESKIEEVA